MNPPCALVLGASGQIGRFLVPRLLSAGWSVLAVSRRPPLSRQGGVRWVQGDLFAGMPELPAVEAIFSLGPLDGFARWLARVSLPQAPRIVAMSSMSAVSKRHSADPAEQSLARSLLEAEAALETAARCLGAAWTILRCTLIYGAGMDRNLTPLAQLAAKCRIFPKLAFATGLRQPVHAADLADACLAAVANSQAEQQVLELGGGERLAFSDMLERVIESLPVRILRIPLNEPMARLGLKLVRAVRPKGTPGPAFLDRLRTDLIVDDAPARRILAWSPRGFAPDASTWVPETGFEYS